MKCSTLLVASVCAWSATAQRSLIGAPAPGTNVNVGQQFTVQVVRPNSIEGSIEVGIVIGLQQCGSSGCAPPDQQIGSILFNGQFNPQLHEQPARPYENYTVTVPSGFSTGLAQLATARFHLIGAGPAPVLELNNLTLNVV